jgi:hypothetical protein
MMDIPLSETCWSFNDDPQMFLKSVLKKVFYVFKTWCWNKDLINHRDFSAPVGIKSESDGDAW